MFSNKQEDYEMISQKLQAMFELDKSPVSVKLYEYEDEASGILSKREGKERHCGMVYEAATKKSVFYATYDEMSCPNGAIALGLLDAKLIEGVPKVDPIMVAVGYAPLEKSPFVPDSVVLYCNPIQIMKISQILRQSSGKRLKGDFGGIASLCADVVSKPYLTNESNVSFACNGSRGFTDIDDGELVIGLTMEDVLNLVNY
ncbi:MAG: hypothetical protein BZ135_07715 [Methanosphaera sp. rholeuAM6]|nr:MAG: hypothetical protein BZ135_07715 [Methanosphaera sp. rholeuAM6]